MRQLLMLGFYCEVYRREPRCRVYVNDVLVDEFNIAKCDQVQAKVDTNLDPLGSHKLLGDFITNPPFFKYIEFDDAGAEKLDVVLRIQNDDNDYANGFMNKYTHIVLRHVYLASKKVMENIDNLMNNFKFSRENWLKYNRNIAYWYANSHRPRLLENFVPYFKFNLPGIKLQPNQNLCTYRIGTSGYFHLTLTKKLGFWLPSTNCRGGFWALGWVDHVKYLYDKYKSYEDTRSTDQ